MRCGRDAAPFDNRDREGLSPFRDRKFPVQRILTIIGFDASEPGLPGAHGAKMSRILLAESDQLIRQFFAGILSDCGHVVESCADAVEATSSLATHSIDVVVTDLVLESGHQTGLVRDCAALGIPTFTLSGRQYHPGLSPTERPAALLGQPFRFHDLQTVLDAVRLPPESEQRQRPEEKQSAFAATALRRRA